MLLKVIHLSVCACNLMLKVRKKKYVHQTQIILLTANGQSIADCRYMLHPSCADCIDSADIALVLYRSCGQQ